MPGWQYESPPPLVLTARLPFGRDASAADERAAFALLAEAEIFQEQDGVDRERIVELDSIDVLRAEPGHLVGGLSGGEGAGHRQIRHARNVGVGGRLAAAQHIGGRLLERLGALGRCDDDRAAAVGDETAVAHRERIAHHPGREHAIDRQRLLLPRGRVEQRPFARGHRDRGQLLARRAELMHVARGRERVGARRQERLERRFVRIDLAHGRLLAADAALRAAIGDHGDVAEAERNRAHRMRDVILERRAADDGRARGMAD